MKVLLYFLLTFAFVYFLGGISAALTTPLDVAKTRIMLAKVSSTYCNNTVLKMFHL